MEQNRRVVQWNVFLCDAAEQDGIENRTKHDTVQAWDGRARLRQGAGQRTPI